ncbi:hypothetical protein [Roseisolibacter sp. H3M3-2]|nr:hypothetical protein [Roseisolibacter sp. H3M3-2]MDF1502445.1 hypothetical protein [Roseisolibacter sp. H3M3-2]
MPPDNGVYFQAAYAVIGVLYAGYALLLMRRRARVRKALDETSR